MINNPIFRSELLNIKELENLKIFKVAQGTNFPVSINEWKVIQRIIANKLN
jgi:hypothetical protein